MTSWKHLSGIFVLWLYICNTLVIASSQYVDQTFILKAAENVIRHYNSNNNITNKDLMKVEDFQLFLEKATLQTNVFLKTVLGICQEGNISYARQAECPVIADVFHSFSNNCLLTTQDFIAALPEVLNKMTSDNCSNGVVDEAGEGRHKRRPTIGEAWGYSIGFGTLIILISNIGACLGPTMKKRFFRRILQFLVAMGAGSLASTSVLVLLPEAFDVIAVEDLNEYVWKATVTMSSIYVFFCLERIMKAFLRPRKKLNNNISIIVEEPENNGVDDTSLTPLSKINEECNSNNHTSSEDDHAARKTLAWMVMIGDFIHNFVDGLSIGAAFSEDAALGVSISLAIVCEAIPHELADIAILLHSGLSIKKALFINFLSACFCYIGIAVGVTLGNMSTEASKWIFAMAGGLFLYVPLVDMLPDMSNHVDSLLQSGSSEAKVVVILHACGLTIGAGIVVFVVNISAYIVI